MISNHIVKIFVACLLICACSAMEHTKKKDPFVTLVGEKALCLKKRAAESFVTEAEIITSKSQNNGELNDLPLIGHIAEKTERLPFECHEPIVDELQKRGHLAEASKNIDPLLWKHYTISSANPIFIKDGLSYAATFAEHKIKIYALPSCTQSHEFEIDERYKNCSKITVAGMHPNREILCYYAENENNLEGAREKTAVFVDFEGNVIVEQVDVKLKKFYPEHILTSGRSGKICLIPIENTEKVVTCQNTDGIHFGSIKYLQKQGIITGLHIWNKFCAWDEKTGKISYSISMPGLQMVKYLTDFVALETSPNSSTWLYRLDDGMLHVQLECSTCPLTLLPNNLIQLVANRPFIYDVETGTKEITEGCISMSSPDCFLATIHDFIAKKSFVVDIRTQPFAKLAKTSYYLGGSHVINIEGVELIKGSLGTRLTIFKRDADGEKISSYSNDLRQVYISKDCSLIIKEESKSKDNLNTKKYSVRPLIEAQLEKCDLQAIQLILEYTEAIKNQKQGSFHLSEKDLATIERMPEVFQKMFAGRK